MKSKPAPPAHVPVTVSDHAIVRYLERVVGVDIAALRRDILTTSIANMANRTGGSGTFANAEDRDSPFRVVVHDFNVVTVLNYRAVRKSRKTRNVKRHRRPPPGEDLEDY